MKNILIILFLVTPILTATEAHNKNRRHGFRSGRQESSLEEKDSEVESCDDFCARRERERQREQDVQRACEQQRGKHKCKSSPRKILGIPGLLPPPGVVELHKRIFPLSPFIRSKRSPMAWSRKYSKNFHGDRSGSSNRQRESDCECDRRMMSTTTPSTTILATTDSTSTTTPTTTMRTTAPTTTTPESTMAMSTTTPPTTSTSSTTESTTTTTTEPTTTTTRSTTMTTRKRRRELDD